MNEEGLIIFENLVKKLLSADNIERKDAEKQYETYLDNAAVTCCAHLQIIKSEKDVSVSSMCAVLLRRLIEDKSRPFEGYTPDQRDAIKTQLIELFQQPFSSLLRKHITNCLGAAVLATKDDGSWNDLVPFLLRCICDTSDDELRCCCLYFFQQTASCFIDKIVASQHFESFKDTLIACVLQAKSIKVRTTGWETIGHCVTLMEKADALKMGEAVSVFTRVLEEVIGAGEHEAVSEMMNTLVDIADNQIEFLEPHLYPLLHKALVLGHAQDQIPSTTSYAVEFILVACECLPKKIRAVKDYVRDAFELAMQLTSRVTEDSEWGLRGIDKAEDDDTNDHDLGLEALDRMSCALKGKCLAPIAMKSIMERVRSDDWRMRQAALLSVGQITEGCKNSFVKNLDSLVSLVLNNLDDPHPRVRFASLSSLAQIFTDFADELRNRYAQIVPALYRRLEDDTPRIQTLAAASLCNLCDSASMKEVDTFSHDILSKVSALLTSSPHLFVKEQCVGTIAAVAENGSKHFGHFYADLLPMLTAILDLPREKGNNLLRCRALDAVTLMACAVGKERFAPDSAHVCRYLKANTNGACDSDDPFFRYVLRGWSCMVRTLEDDFEPYIDDALQYIFRTLREPTELECLDDIEDDDEECQQEGTQIIKLSIKGQGERRIKLRTSLIEDKILALTLLLLIIEKCGSHIVKYLEEVIQLVTPLLKFTFTDEVRNLAARISGACISSSARYNRIAGNAYTETISLFAVHFIQKIVDALQEESDTNAAIEFLAALDTILKNIVPNVLDDETITTFKDVMRQVFAEGIKRRQELFTSIEEEDEEDVEDIMEEHEDEETLLIEAVDVIGRLLKTQDKFFPIFLREFLPDFQNLLGDNLGSSEHKIALCVLDDFLEIKPETAVQMFTPIFNAMMKFCCAESYEVTQAACYGLGLCVDLLARDNALCPQGNSIQSVVNTIAAKVGENMTRKQDDVEEYYHAIANVASCAVKLHRSFASLLSNESVLIQGILGVLPIQFDWEEACIVHKYILQLVQQNAASVSSHKSNIVEVLKSQLDSDSLDDDTKTALRMM